MPWQDVVVAVRGALVLRVKGPNSVAVNDRLLRLLLHVGRRCCRLRQHTHAPRLPGRLPWLRACAAAHPQRQNRHLVAPKPNGGTTRKVWFF